MSLKEKKVLRAKRNDELKFLTSILYGIFKDAMRDFITIPRREWKRDVNTILFLLEHRGISVLTDLLPLIDDTLTGVVKGEQANFSGPLGSGHTPKFLRGLWRLVIDDDGYIYDSADHTAIFYLRQFSLFSKKANISLKNDKKSERKINGYESIEKDLHSPSKRWFMDDFYGADSHAASSVSLLDAVHPDLFDSGNTSSLCESITCIQEIGDYFSKYLDFISRWIREPVITSESRYIDRKRRKPFKHGPGATATTSRYTDKYNFREVQPSLLMYLQRQEASQLIGWLECSNVKVRERSSKIVLVPKDSRGPRVIAAEPVLNQFVQQAGYNFIKNFVVRATPASKSIDFTNQGLSKVFARNASIDGCHATIDLSDASDRLSLYVIERLFHGSQSFLEFIHGCRTKSAQYNGRVFTDLKKFASQGNALTFPLQTLVYYIVCLGVLFAKRRERFSVAKAYRFSEELRVFGDDLIVPVDIYNEVTEVLQHLQLKVNEKKSFATGLFRESCGGDYIGGNDVAPVKIRSVDVKSPNGQQMLLDVSNEAFTKGLWHTSSVLLDFFRGRNSRGEILQPIIHVDHAGLGLKCYSGFTSRHLETRWNTDSSSIQSKIWISSSKNWKCERTGTSRACEFAMTDTSQPEWAPMFIQRSQSSSRIGWL